MESSEYSLEDFLIPVASSLKLLSKIALKIKINDALSPEPGTEQDVFDTCMGRNHLAVPI